MELKPLEKDEIQNIARSAIEDCVDFVVDEYYDEGFSKDDLYVNFLIIKFLSKHCIDAVSSQDLNYMAQQQRGNDI